MRPAAPALGEFEQIVLLAVLCAGTGEDAYGVNVHAEIERRTRRRVARGAVYMTLDRLEKKGLLSSYLSETLLSRDETRAGGAAGIAPGAAEPVAGSGACGVRTGA